MEKATRDLADTYLRMYRNDELRAREALLEDCQLDWPDPVRDEWIEEARVRTFDPQAYGDEIKEERMPIKRPYQSNSRPAAQLKIEEQPEEQPEPKERPTGDIIPEPPNEDEQLELYQNTHFQPFIDGARKVAPITPAFPILGNLVLQSAWMTPCVTVNGKKPNMFGLAVGEQSSGKGTCLNALVRCLMDEHLSTMPKASSKSFLKKVAASPWGTMTVGEFAAYIKNDWLSDALYNLNDAYDGIEIGEASEKTGTVTIRNASPNLFACIQTNKFLTHAMKEFLDSGFFARTLIGLDDKQTAEWVSLKPRGENVMIDCQPIAQAFKSFYSWLPERNRPAKESTELILKDGKDDKPEYRGLGIWNHPEASVNMVVEPFADYWQTHQMPAAVVGVMQRLIPNYLPLVSIPFCDPKALREHRITADALARGQRVLLVFYHNFLKLAKIVPENDKGAVLIKEILAKIQRSYSTSILKGLAGVPRREIQRDVHYDTVRQFDDAMEVIKSRSLAIIAKAEKNKNNTFSKWYAPNEEKGRRLAPIAAMAKSIPSIPKLIRYPEPDISEL